MECLPELQSEMKQRAQKVRVILMDVDGVLTNGEIVYNSVGEETKFFNSHDGLGIRLANEAGLKTGLISARESEAIRMRARELKIEILFLGKYHKRKSYDTFKENYHFKDEEVCFIGDDLPDLPVLNLVGFPVAVKNAHSAVKEQIHFHTQREGGRGAVREAIEFILDAQGKLDKAMEYIVKLD
jgi:3-deoxy-D-manno-octulosonate 8-phosphate phosphatase (KDO 8-P phosphatase)